MKKSTKFFLALLGLSTAAGAYAEEAAWQSVSAATYTTYAIKSDGTLWAWGSGEYGELGDGNSGNNHAVNVPVQMGEATNWATVVGGESRVFALNSNKELFATGSWESGALGVETTSNIKELTQVGTDANWASVSSSFSSLGRSTLAIKSDGTLWGWGYNMGLLGTGKWDQCSLPTQIGTDTDWKQVSVGSGHSLALKTDGSIWATGAVSSFDTDIISVTSDQTNSDGSTTKAWVKVAEADNWKAVYAIEGASYAIKEDGTLWAWGSNYRDLIGLNTGNSDPDATVPVKNPTQITTITGALKIVGSQYVRVVLTDTNSDGVGDKVYVWGYNYSGVLGNGDDIERSENVSTVTVPQEVTMPDGVDGIADISAGDLHVVAITTDNKLIGWGQNKWGQLGIGQSTTNASTPIEIGVGDGAIDPGAEFDAANIPASLASVEKITLTGEWGTDDFQSLITAIGNTTGLMGFNYNTTLLTVDMSNVTFKENTELTNVFRNCSVLETVIMPTNESTANVVSLDNTFLNDNVLSTIDVSNLINVSNLNQAFQNCKAITTVDLSKWVEVTNSAYAFQNCDALTAIVLPGKFEISDRCFGGDYALKLIDWSKYEGTTCPRGADANNNYEPFYGLDFVAADKASITIMVPATAYASFSSDSYWGGFNIQEAAGTDTYTIVNADDIPASLADITHIRLTGLWDTDKFKALATALGTASSITASNSTLVAVDMSQAEIAEETDLVMSVPGVFGNVNKGVFRNNTALETVVMPAAAQAANFASMEQAFYGCSALKEIDLSGCSGITSTTEIFYNCSSLTSVKLPAISRLNSDAFYGCTALTTLDWSLFPGTEAPSSSSALPDLGNPKDLTVIVPAAAYDSFNANAWWNKFTLVSTGQTGIDDIVADDSIDTVRPVYNFAGQRVATLAPGEDASTLPSGLYIIAGQKVLVK